MYSTVITSSSTSLESSSTIPTRSGDHSLEFYDNSILLKFSLNWIFFFFCYNSCCYNIINYIISNMKVVYDVYINVPFWLRRRITNILTYLCTSITITTATSIARITIIHHRMIGSTLLPSFKVSRS